MNCSLYPTAVRFATVWIEGVYLLQHFFLYSYSLVEKIGNEQSNSADMLLNEVQKVIAMRSDIDSGVDNINNCLCYFIMVISTSFPGIAQFVYPLFLGGLRFCMGITIKPSMTSGILDIKPASRFRRFLRHKWNLESNHERQ